MTNEEIEKKIEELRLLAPRVSLAGIKDLIKDVTYTVLPSGKVMVCEITLQNGFTVRGDSAVVSKANFNHELGRQISYQRAFDQIWQLEGYALQQKLFEQATKES